MRLSVRADSLHSVTVGYTVHLPIVYSHPCVCVIWLNVALSRHAVTNEFSVDVSIRLLSMNAVTYQICCLFIRPV